MVDYTETEVAELFNSANTRLESVSQGCERVLNDLFSGRDPGNGYLAGGYFSPTRVTSPWVYPEISANLMQTRLRELVIELVPDLPKMEVKALIPEATWLEEEQSLLSNWGTRAGNLRDTIRKVAMYGPMGTHVGIRLEVNKDLPLHRRISYTPLSHTECGYEPGLRRFVWHTYSVSEDEICTEVFFPDADDLDCTVYKFKRTVNQKDSLRPLADAADVLGDFQGSSRLGAACPVRVTSFLTAPPGEDIAPVECMSWVPLLRAIQTKLEARDREARSICNGVLYDSSKIDRADVEELSRAATGETVFIPVRTDGDLGDGVSHVMRPLERRSSMMELNAALEADIALLDDVIGTSALNRGAAIGPRKSAAEASILSQASSRRTRDRLTVIAELLADVEQAKFTWQREAYGKSVKIPLAEGLSRLVRVPDPKVALMNFRVDAVELGNLSKQGQVETYAAAVSLISNTFAQYQGGQPPAAVKEALRRYLKALGVEDISQFIEDPAISGGPQERWIRYLKRPFDGLVTDQNDPPEPFIMYYTQQYNDSATSLEAKKELSKAIAFYSQLKQQAEQAQMQMMQQAQAQGGAGLPQEAVPVI